MAQLGAYGNYGSGVYVNYSVSGRTISWTFYVWAENSTWQDRYFTWSLSINGVTQISNGGDNTYYSSYNTSYNKGSGSYAVPGTDARNVSISISCNSSYYTAPGACSNSTSVSIAATGYTVSYNANGGSGAPGNQTKIHGTTLTLSSTKPTRTGYTFSKWNTKADGTGTNYNSGGSYTANAAVTLYAQWTINTYTVKIDPNGGSFTSSKNSTAQSTAQTYTVNYGTNITSINASRSGYLPAGWYTEASGGSKVLNNNGNLNSINQNYILYAHWTAETPPPDPIYDIYMKIGDSWVPGVLWIKIGDTWYRVIGTEIKVSDTWRKSKAT